MTKQTIIERLYKKKYEEYLKRIEELKDPNTLYVTDIIGCFEKYRLKKIMPIFYYSNVLLHGDIIHTGIEELLGEELNSEEPMEYEIQIFNTKLKLKGRPDLIDTENKEIVEIKTISEVPEEPLQHHIDQLAIYLAMARELFKDMFSGRLVYISRKNWREYTFEYVDLVEPDYKTFLYNKIYSFFEEGKSPRYEWECYYCPFKEICQARYRKKKEEKVEDGRTTQ